MPSLRRAFRPAVLFCAVGLSGCALTPKLDGLHLATVEGEPRFELTETPFHPQEMHQCGPAALATVLGAGGIAVTPETLADEVYIPGREGSLQAELVAAVRSHERVAVRLQPHLESVLAPLRERRPVLLLQNLGFKNLPRWHYAVLVGWNAADDRLILRSGGDARERMSLARFLQTWDLGGRWAVVIADPLTPPPAAVDPHDWIAAVAPLESLGRADHALVAYDAATWRWPDEPLVWQALANARYAMGDLAGAEQALDTAVDLQASPAALNNLAQIRIERGCPHEALKTLDRIGDIPPTLAGTVADTRSAALAIKPSGQIGRCR